MVEMDIKWTDLTETDRDVIRKILKHHLHESVVNVVFKKKDGTERTMKCTLKPDQVVDYEKKTDKTKEPSLETCPVFDLDKQEWRSFRYDSIISFDRE